MYQTDIKGFPHSGGTPIAGWFIVEKPNKNWMIWGYPLVICYITIENHHRHSEFSHE